MSLSSSIVREYLQLEECLLFLVPIRHIVSDVPVLPEKGFIGSETFRKVKHHAPIFTDVILSYSEEALALSVAYAWGVYKAL